MTADRHTDLRGRHLWLHRSIRQSKGAADGMTRDFGQHAKAALMLCVHRIQRMADEHYFANGSFGPKQIFFYFIFLCLVKRVGRRPQYAHQTTGPGLRVRIPR